MAGCGAAVDLRSASPDDLSADAADPPYAAPPPTIALDATIACTGFGSCSYTATSNNDVIVAWIFCGGNPTLPTVTSVSGGGVTWARRATLLTPGGHGRLDEWYAQAIGSFSATVTPTFSSACSDGTIIVRGVVNANATTPFDPNVSLPVPNAATGTTPSASGISTTQHNTLMMAGIGTGNGNYQTSPDVTGWDLWAGTLNLGGCCAGSNRTNSKVFGTVQSSQTITFGVSGSYDWAMIVDALQDATQ